MHIASEYQIKKSIFHHYTLCGTPLRVTLDLLHLIAIQREKELVLVGTGSEYFFIIRWTARNMVAACGKVCVGAEY